MTILYSLRSTRRIQHLLKSVNIIKLIWRNAVDLAHNIYGNIGKDTPIIVLHGFLGSKRNWDSVCKKIASSTSMTVVAADLRNHGISPHDSSHTYPELAADVSQLISKLSINSANVIGHSMGGRTAMMLALTEPSNIAKLVVVDVSPISFYGNTHDFFPRLLDVMASIDFKGLDSGDARTTARTKLMASGLVQHRVLLDFIIMNIAKKKDGTFGWQINVDALKRHFMDVATFPDMSGKKFEGPVLFIGGDQSGYIPPEDLPGIKILFPKANLTYVKGVGHNVHTENTTEFVKIVTAFLK